MEGFKCPSDHTIAQVLFVSYFAYQLASTSNESFLSKFNMRVYKNNTVLATVVPHRHATQNNLPVWSDPTFLSHGARLITIAQLWSSLSDTISKSDGIGSILKGNMSKIVNVTSLFGLLYTIGVPNSVAEGLNSILTASASTMTYLKSLMTWLEHDEVIRMTASRNTDVSEVDLEFTNYRIHLVVFIVAIMADMNWAKRLYEWYQQKQNTSDLFAAISSAIVLLMSFIGYRFVQFKSSALTEDRQNRTFNWQKLTRMFIPDYFIMYGNVIRLTYINSNGFADMGRALVDTMKNSLAPIKMILNSIMTLFALFLKYVFGHNLDRLWYTKNLNTLFNPDSNDKKTQVIAVILFLLAGVLMMYSTIGISTSAINLVLPSASDLFSIIFLFDRTLLKKTIVKPIGMFFKWIGTCEPNSTSNTPEQKSSRSTPEQKSSRATPDTNALRSTSHATHNPTTKRKITNSERRNPRKRRKTYVKSTNQQR